MTRRRDDSREDALLREFFSQVHADDRPPSFTRVARARPPAPRAGSWIPRPAVAIAAVLLVAVAAAWLVPWLPGPGSVSLSDEEQMALAVELSSWEAPLDFLLDTPGREVFVGAPSLELTALKIPPPADGEETKP